MDKIFEAVRVQMMCVVQWKPRFIAEIKQKSVFRCEWIITKLCIRVIRAPIKCFDKNTLISHRILSIMRFVYVKILLYFPQYFAYLMNAGSNYVTETIAIYCSLLFHSILIVFPTLIHFRFVFDKIFEMIQMSLMEKHYFCCLLAYSFAFCTMVSVLLHVVYCLADKLVKC